MKNERGFWCPGKSRPNPDREVKENENGTTYRKPSKELMAMKFMKKASSIANEAERDVENKVLDEEFNLEWRLSLSGGRKRQRTRQNGVDVSGKLACECDVQHPDRVVIGRRSFNGFNRTVEEAYDSCVASIRSGMKPQTVQVLQVLSQQNQKEISESQRSSEASSVGMAVKRRGESKKLKKKRGKCKS